MQTQVGVKRNLWATQQSGLLALKRMNFPIDGLELYLPLGHPELSGSPIISKDLNAHSCTVVGAVHNPPTDRDFDSLDDIITIPSHVSIDNIFDGGGTVMAWINPASDGESNAGMIITSLTLTPTVGWRCFVFQEAAGFVKVRFEITHSGDDGIWDSASAVVPINTWSLFGFTYNADSVSNNPIFYLNGAISAFSEFRAPTGTRDSASGKDWMIGNRPDTTTTFDGLIGEVWGYSKIRTLREFDHINKATEWGYV